MCLLPRVFALSRRLLARLCRVKRILVLCRTCAKHCAYHNTSSIRRAPLNGLSDSGLDRFLPPPGDDEQPDDPRKPEYSAEHGWDLQGGRDALGSDNPALHEDGESLQSHDVANRPGNPCRPHDHEREEHQRETKHEPLIACCPPLHPPDCFCTGKACCPLRRRCADPRSIRLLVGNSIHGLKDAVQCKRYPCRHGPEEAQPARGSLRDAQREVQDEESRNEGRRPDELPQMDSGPAQAVRGSGKRGMMVIATSRVQKPCYLEDQETDKQ